MILITERIIQWTKYTTIATAAGVYLYLIVRRTRETSIQETTARRVRDDRQRGTTGRARLS